MIEAFSNILTAFGLSASAGLNAYLTLLLVALIARFTDLITLNPPFDLLTNEWVIIVLGVLLAIEILVDKIPAVDTLNDLIGTFVRPVAGAILFAASSNVIADVNPVLALICGLILAGGVHAVKATARPVVTATTGGIANPLISLAEDVVAATTTLLAILVPLLAFALILGLLLVVLTWYRRRRRPSGVV